MYTWNFDETGFKEKPNLDCTKHRKEITYTSQNGTLFLYSMNSGQGNIFPYINETSLPKKYIVSTTPFRL